MPESDKPRAGGERGRLKLTQRDKQVFGASAATLSVFSVVVGLVSSYVHSSTNALLLAFGVLVVASMGYLAISRAAGRRARVPLLPAAAGSRCGRCGRRDRRHRRLYRDGRPLTGQPGNQAQFIGLSRLCKPRERIASAGNPAASDPAAPYRVFSDPNTVNVSAVAFSPDSKTLAAADVNGGAFL